MSEVNRYINERCCRLRLWADLKANVLHKGWPKRLLAYMHLYCGFASLTTYWAYAVYDCEYFDIGLLLGIFYILFLYIMYVLINHNLVKRVMPYKTIIISEIILLLVLIALFFSEMEAGHRSFHTALFDRLFGWFM